MKKNLLITILTLVLCLFMVVPVLAEGEAAEDGFADEYYRLHGYGIPVIGRGRRLTDREAG